VGEPSTDGASFHSGFVAFIGRPNVGKSSLVNRICGQKVSIVSDKPQTTRHRVRGVLHRDHTQVVFVDTPGLHKPVTALGERTNATAVESISDVDVVCLVIDATMPFGRGDRFVAERVPADGIVVLNKVDRASHQQIAQQLGALAELQRAAYFCVSARTGDGIDDLIGALLERMPEGPPYFPRDEVSDQSAETWVAELVREQLLMRTREELPHSIATRVTEWDRTDRGDRIRVQIVVERDSQKGIVIGKGGAMLRDVGTAARQQLPPGTHLDLAVTVDRNWQHRADRVDRLLD
jgi:GTPase